MSVAVLRPADKLLNVGNAGVRVVGRRAVAAVGGILDGVSNIAAAYALHQLRTAYAGSAVRVRRSSDNSEQDIGFVAGEFDSASFSSFVGGGSGFIAKWYDQGGSGNDLTQATAANQPLYVAGVYNGKPTVRFDGTDDFFELGFTLAQPEDVICVWKALSTQALDVTFDGHAPDSMELRQNNGDPTKMDIYSGAFLTQTAVTPTAAMQVWRILFNGVSSKVYISGGTAFASGDAGSSAATGLALAARGDGNARNSNIDVTAFVVKSAAYSLGELNAMGSALATRFGLSWSTAS